MVKPVRFTDSHKFNRPYVDSKASSEPGYLSSRFKQIREQQEHDEAERKAKVRQAKRA